MEKLSIFAATSLVNFAYFFTIISLLSLFCLQLSLALPLIRLEPKEIENLIYRRNLCKL